MAYSYRVVCGSMDIVVVFPMSTSCSPMLAHACSILSCASYASRMQCPCGLTVVYNISPPLNLASRDIAFVDRFQTNVTGQDIIWMCHQCDISVRQHYKVVIIPSVTSRHHPDMTWNVQYWSVDGILLQLIYQSIAVNIHIWPVVYKYLNFITKSILCSPWLAIERLDRLCVHSVNITMWCLMFSSQLVSYCSGVGIPQLCLMNWLHEETCNNVTVPQFSSWKQRCNYPFQC